MPLSVILLYASYWLSFEMFFSEASNTPSILYSCFAGTKYLVAYAYSETGAAFYLVRALMIMPLVFMVAKVNRCEAITLSVIYSLLVVFNSAMAVNFANLSEETILDNARLLLDGDGECWPIGVFDVAIFSVLICHFWRR